MVFWCFVSCFSNAIFNGVSKIYFISISLNDASKTFLKIKFSRVYS